MGRPLRDYMRVHEEAISKQQERVAKDRDMQKKPVVKLIGEDGNIFVIIGRVYETLKKESTESITREFLDLTFKQRSYNDVLVLVKKYVEIV